MTKAALEAWQEVQNDEHPVNYIVLTFGTKGKEKKKIVVRSKGAGGLLQALEHVTDDEIFFVGCRVSAIDAIESHEGDDKGHAAVSIRPRFIKFCFVGKNLSGFKKATQLTSSTAILAKLKNTILDFKEVDGIRENIEKDSIEDRLDVMNRGQKDLKLDWTNSALMKQMHLEQYDVMNADHVEIKETPKKKKKKKKKEDVPIMLEADDDIGDTKEDEDMMKFRNRRTSMRLVRQKSFMRDKTLAYVANRIILISTHS